MRKSIPKAFIVLAIISSSSSAASRPTAAAGSGRGLPGRQARRRVGMSSERLALLDTLMNEAVDRKDFPGRRPPRGP